MKRGRKALVLVAVFVALLAASLPARAFPLGPFCDPLDPPDTISGQGTRSELAIFYGLWLPSYVAKCGTASGKVSYSGTSDSFAASAMLKRQGHFFGRDAALQPLDQALIENDLFSTNLDYIGLTARIASVQHIPMFLNVFAVAFRLNCGGPTVRLSGVELAQIFSGTITKWNDAQLVQTNPALKDCSNAIKLAARSDESGTTTVFKDYMAKRLPTMRPYVVPQLASQWPPAANIVCKGYGDDGVAGCVAAQNGTIGYMSQKVAHDAGLQIAQIDNAAGTFSGPSQAGCTAAAQSSTLPPSTAGDWSSTSLTNPPDGYAFCGLSFILGWDHYGDAYGKINVNKEQVRNLRDFLTVALSDPVQAGLTTYGVAPLPANVLALSRTGLNSLQYL